MFAKLITTVSVAVLLMTVPVIAQNNTTDPLLLKKKHSQGTTEQGTNQKAGQGNAQQDQSSNAQTGSGQGTADQQQDSQEATDQGTGMKKKKVQQNSQNQNSTDQGQNTNQTQRTQQNDNSQVTGSTSKANDIPTEKRTIIREKLVTKNVTKIDRSKVNFNINVGVAVPSTIELHPLPAEVVEILPDYRGYDYFVLADGTIIIVDPNSHNIIFVLSA